MQFQAPVLTIRKPERSRCCLSPERSLDVCGRNECVNCSLPLGESGPLVDLAGTNAFMHETSGAKALDTRQACAVESLALLNPDLTVHLLMTSPAVDVTAPSMKALEEYNNIRISSIDLDRYFSSSPLEHWYFCTTWNYGPYAVSHLSDALRFLTLYKYGGFYFDLDIIHLKSVTSSFRNFVVADVGKEYLAAGAFHADLKHPVVRLALEEFRNTYSKKDWGYNGPELFTRILQRYCQVKNVNSMTSGKCHGFRVLPPESFYPIDWLSWRRYFERSATTPQWPEEVIGLHVWNKVSAEEPVIKTSDQVYARVARSQCPHVISTAPDVF